MDLADPPGGARGIVSGPRQALQMDKNLPRLIYYPHLSPV